MAQLPHCHLRTAGRLQVARPRGLIPSSPHVSSTPAQPGLTCPLMPLPPGGVPLKAPSSMCRTACAHGRLGGTEHSAHEREAAGRGGGPGLVPWFIGQCSGTKPRGLGPRARPMGVTSVCGRDLRPGGAASCCQGSSLLSSVPGASEIPASDHVYFFPLLPPRSSNTIESLRPVTMCAPRVSGSVRTFHRSAPGAGVGPARSPRQSRRRCDALPPVAVTRERSRQT